MRRPSSGWGRIRFAGCLLFLQMAAGCRPGLALSADPDGHAVPASQVHRQLIISFQDPAFPCNAAAIAEFAASTKVRLEFLRPMSGNACVVRQVASDAAGLAAGQKRMKAHRAIGWLEPDAVMTPQ